MLVWLGVNLYEFYGFPFCSGQYVGIRLGRAGHSGQIEAAWDKKLSFKMGNFPFPSQFALVRCNIVGLLL